MDVIDHGEWVYYTPKKPHPDAPPSALYARRTSDHVDWYSYAYTPGMFTKKGVKITCRKEGDDLIVMAATRDQTAIFPVDCLLVELTESNVLDKDLISYFSRRIYNPETQEFGDRK